MKLTKSGIKKLIGYFSSILVLIFLGEDFLQGSADIISVFNQAR